MATVGDSQRPPGSPYSPRKWPPSTVASSAACEKPPLAAGEADAANSGSVRAPKRHRPDPSTAVTHCSSHTAITGSGALPQHQYDRCHLRGQQTASEWEGCVSAPADTACLAIGNHSLQQQGQEQHQAGRHSVQLHKHRRSKQASKRQHLLSFASEDSPDDDASNADPTAPGVQYTAECSSKVVQPQGLGMSQATAAKFRAEARQATSTRFTFKPSGSNAQAEAEEQHNGLGLVDEDVDERDSNVPAGLSQIHFGTAQACGARPYMEDRHCIVTNLKLSSLATAAAGEDSYAAFSHLVGSSVSSGPGDILQPQQELRHKRLSMLQDGVARSYAAIFDGHNGAGAADTAARQLHVLLASHPALKLHKGAHSPVPVVKQEEAAVGKALKAAFRQVDDLVLAVARRDGTRDGATALVVLRFGDALYAAHAGDSRAVLCRDGLAQRLTEDHKPHLPQERQRIEDAGGRVDFQRCWRVVVEPRDGRPGSGLAVSRSLGDLDFKEPARFVECEPDVVRVALQPHKDTFVILGSDGLWDVLSDTDAVMTAAAALKAYATAHQHSSSHQQAAAAALTAATQLYKQHGPQQHGGDIFLQPGCTPQEDNAELPACFMYCDGAATAAAEALLAESMRRGTMDNVTVIVMLLQWG